MHLSLLAHEDFNAIPTLLDKSTYLLNQENIIMHALVNFQGILVQHVRQDHQDHVDLQAHINTLQAHYNNLRTQQAQNQQGDLATDNFHEAIYDVFDTLHASQLFRNQIVTHHAALQQTFPIHDSSSSDSSRSTDSSSHASDSD